MPSQVHSEDLQSHPEPLPHPQDHLLPAGLWQRSPQDRPAPAHSETHPGKIGGVASAEMDRHEHFPAGSPGPSPCGGL